MTSAVTFPTRITRSSILLLAGFRLLHTVISWLLLTAPAPSPLIFIMFTMLTYSCCRYHLFTNACTPSSHALTCPCLPSCPTLPDFPCTVLQQPLLCGSPPTVCLPVCMAIYLVSLDLVCLLAVVLCVQCAIQ